MRIKKKEFPNPQALKKYSDVRVRLLRLVKLANRTKEQERELKVLRIAQERFPHSALSWVLEAQGQLNASECLRKFVVIWPPGQVTSPAFRKQQRAANQKAGVLLLSLALENSLKAALIALDAIDFSNEKQSAHFHTHNLRLLYDYLKETGHAPKINVARLDEAQRCIEWGGKYPTPKRPEQFGLVITFDTRREINRFTKRLWKIVFDVDDLIYASAPEP